MKLIPVEIIRSRTCLEADRHQRIESAAAILIGNTSDKEKAVDAKKLEKGHQGSTRLTALAYNATVHAVLGR
jgi:hypothetical protein